MVHPYSSPSSWPVKVVAEGVDEDLGKAASLSAFRCALGAGMHAISVAVLQNNDGDLVVSDERDDVPTPVDTTSRPLLSAALEEAALFGAKCVIEPINADLNRVLAVVRACRMDEHTVLVAPTERVLRRCADKNSPWASSRLVQRFNPKTPRRQR